MLESITTTNKLAASNLASLLNCPSSLIANQWCLWLPAGCRDFVANLSPPAFLRYEWRGHPGVDAPRRRIRPWSATPLPTAQRVEEPCIGWLSRHISPLHPESAYLSRRYRAINDHSMTYVGHGTALRVRSPSDRTALGSWTNTGQKAIKLRVRSDHAQNTIATFRMSILRRGFASSEWGISPLIARRILCQQGARIVR